MGRKMYGLQLPFQIILISLIGQLGSAVRPVVTFNPDWNKFHTGQSITMTCTVEPPASSYHWYHNGNEISTTTKKNYTISVAWTGDSGDYKCWTSAGGTSEIVTLSVSDDPVLLQAPLHVYEGDNISLQCSSLHNEPLAKQTIFYRNNQIIPKSATSYNLLLIKYTDLTATYKCSKSVPTTISNTFSAYTTISYTENVKTIPVTFTPNWNKLLTGDSITMTCHEGYNDPLSYHWFLNGILVAERQIYTITSAQVGHSGTYQCRTDRGDSLPFSLEVSDGPLILQAPFFVNQGKDVHIRCHGRPGHSVQRITYYKDNVFIYGSSSELNYPVIYGNHDVSGRYRCDRVLSRLEYVTNTDEVSLYVRDLFSKPNITTMLYPMTEGDSMTLTCDTRLSPLRQRTELQFAFYRDGLEVRGFSSSHQYEVQSAQPKDSGNYSCEVRTPTNSVMKRSEELYIQTQRGIGKQDGYILQNIIRLVLSGLIIIALAGILYDYVKTERRHDRL